MVTQIGGHIDTYSEENRGTTFKVYFPRSDRRVAEEQEEAVPAPVSLDGTETVLVVEDRPVIRNLIVEVLSRRGYTVLPVQNGVDALRIVAEPANGIDLVLTDIVMPGLNGQELAAKIAELRPRQKVLYMSGYTATVLSQQKLLDRNMAFLQKPFTPDSLVRKIRGVLDGPVSAETGKT